MVYTPAPEADEKNSFRLLHLLKLISKVRHLRAAVGRRNEILTQAPEAFFERNVRQCLRTSQPLDASRQPATSSR